MSKELESAVKKMFRALDSGDAVAMKATMAIDAVGLDEVSRSWMVGKQLFDYVDELLSSVGSLKSELTNINARAWGDTGVVGCVLEQDLIMHGTKHHITAPTTVVLRKEGAEWKIVHFHSAPLPE